MRFLFGVAVGATIGRSGMKILLNQVLKIPSAEMLTSLSNKLELLTSNLESFIERVSATEGNM